MHVHFVLRAVQTCKCRVVRHDLVGVSQYVSQDATKLQNQHSKRICNVIGDKITAM